jgi:hypothetical protein
VLEFVEPPVTVSCRAGPLPGGGGGGGLESSSTITAPPCAFSIDAPEAFERFTKNDSPGSTVESWIVLTWTWRCVVEPLNESDPDFDT